MIYTLERHPSLLHLILFEIFQISEHQMSVDKRFYNMSQSTHKDWRYKYNNFYFTLQSIYMLQYTKSRLAELGLQQLPILKQLRPFTLLSLLQGSRVGLYVICSIV